MMKQSDRYEVDKLLRLRDFFYMLKGLDDCDVYLKLGSAYGVAAPVSGLPCWDAFLTAAPAEVDMKLRLLGVDPGA